ncbi:MAG: PsiF family protein, partial [Rhodanobacteraceae bacterium]
AAAPMEHTKTSQQEKMKSCNAEAKTKALKGAARKSFMSTCLKG